MEEDFERQLTSLEPEFSDVAVVRHVVPGQPRAALLTAALNTQMIVVGCRGRGGIKGMPVGSVAQALLHHSPCPVAVIHEDLAVPGAFIQSRRPREPATRAWSPALPDRGWSG